MQNVFEPSAFMAIFPMLTAFLAGGGIIGLLWYTLHTIRPEVVLRTGVPRAHRIIGASAMLIVIAGMTFMTAKIQQQKFRHDQMMAKTYNSTLKKLCLRESQRALNSIAEAASMPCPYPELRYVPDMLATAPQNGGIKGISDDQLPVWLKGQKAQHERFIRNLQSTTGERERSGPEEDAALKIEYELRERFKGRS